VMRPRLLRISPWGERGDNLNSVGLDVEKIVSA
jgi:hypothetical protein